MPNSEQTRPATPEEDIRALYKRTARLNDRVSALLYPAWGTKHGILPEGHPLRVVVQPDTEEQGAPTDWQATARQRERELKTAGEARHQAEQERDGAYRERAQLLAWLAALHPAVIAPALDLDEPGWWILYLNPAAAGQMSWHISPRDAGIFAHVERVEPDDPRAQWDGHTTPEKYQRIAAVTAGLAERCGPECDEMHTETGRCEIARNRTEDSEPPQLRGTEAAREGIRRARGDEAAPQTPITFAHDTTQEN